MPALSFAASGAASHHGLPERRQRSPASWVHRRLDGVSRWRADHEHGWRAAARASSRAERKTETRGALLHGVSQFVLEPAPGLRNDAHAVAAGCGPDAGDL